MEVFKDYSFVKGVNYKIKDPETTARELGYGARIGLNSVRVWLEVNRYYKNPEAYIGRLVEFVRTCHKCGYTVMPILWNGNMLNPEILRESFFPKGDKYVTDIVTALKDEPGLLMWDIMNEPTCNDYFYEKLPDGEHNKRAEEIWSFLRHYHEVLKSVDSNNACTIGHTLIYDVEPTIECVDVISFHDYSPLRSMIDDQFALAKKLSAKYNKPFMNTETGCIARGNPYDVAIKKCQDNNCGYYIFELMIEGYWGDIHGIFYPDGTVRDPSIIAAIMGCYRKTDPGTVKPNINRENFGEKFANEIFAALKDNSKDAFRFSYAPIERLLDACEKAANLLESAELIPMYDPIMKKITAWRSEVDPDILEIKAFAYDLAMKLKKFCYLE